jgi:hypothetical protein
MARLITIKILSWISGISTTMFFMSVVYNDEATKIIIENRKELSLAAISLISAMFSVFYVLAKRDKLSLENKKKQIENDILVEQLKEKRIQTRIKEIELESLEKEKAPRS